MTSRRSASIVSHVPGRLRLRLSLVAPVATREPGTGRPIDRGFVAVAGSLAATAGVHVVPMRLRLPVALSTTAPLLGHAVEDWRANSLTSHGLEGLAVAISPACADYTAATMTAFMLTLGEHLEASLARQADEMLAGLLRPAGATVWVLRDGAEVAIPRDAVAVADSVVQCLGAKSEAQLEAVRLVARLVPLVLNLAGSAFLVSGDWRRAASVLQADYACALKLATPVAFKSAMYTAGRSGIQVKGAQALERLASADTFVFDKTGSLTSGMFE